MKNFFGKRKSKSCRDLGEAMNASSSSSASFVTQDSPFVTEHHRDGPTVHGTTGSVTQKDFDFSSSFSSVEDLMKSDSHFEAIKKPRSAILIPHPSPQLVLDMELPSPPKKYSSRRIQVAVKGNSQTRSNPRESARPMPVRSASASNILDNDSSRHKRQSTTNKAMDPRNSSSDQILDHTKGSRNQSFTIRRSDPGCATYHVRESNRGHCNLPRTLQDSDSSMEGGMSSAPRRCLPYLQKSKSERMLISDDIASENRQQDRRGLQQQGSFRTQRRNSVTKFNIEDLSNLATEGEDEIENLLKSISLLSASQAQLSFSSKTDDSNPNSHCPSIQKDSDKRPTRSEPSRSQWRKQQEMTRPKSFSGLDRRNSVTEFNLSSSQQDLLNIRNEAADLSRSNRMRGQLAQDLWNDVSGAAGRRSPAILTAPLSKKADRAANVRRSDSAGQIEHFQSGNGSSTLAHSGRRIQKQGSGRSLERLGSMNSTIPNRSSNKIEHATPNAMSKSMSSILSDASDPATSLTPLQKYLRAQATKTMSAQCA